MGLPPFGGARGRSRRRFSSATVSREDSQAFGEVAEFWAWPGSGELEQVAGDGPGAVVAAGQLGREFLGSLQVVDGFADLAPHSVGRCPVDQVPGLPLR